jgi:bacteriorhodopsin
MHQFYRICISLSVGLLIGFLFGGVKSLTQKTYSQEQVEKSRKLINKVAALLKYLTLFLLILGFIWCVYFLVLGVVSPGQADYADNMSELIVSVLTVISIIFAFFEFIRRT